MIRGGKKIKVEIDGIHYSIKEIAEKYGLSYSTVSCRYREGMRDADLIAPVISYRKRCELSELKHFTVGNFVTFSSRNTAAIALHCSSEKLQSDIDKGIYGKATSLSEIISKAWKPTRRVA